MADSTRINELQDKLLQAMDIVNAKALNAISYDKTITCTIETNKNKKEGCYEVSDGSTVFTAYSSMTNLAVGTSVYVTIPNGDFSNQKMIIGKVTTTSSEPFVFTTPFDTIFDMTNNMVDEEVNGSLLANGKNDKDYPISEYGNFEIKRLYTSEELSHPGYTRLGIKADFKSWLSNAYTGNYGLAITITTENPSVAETNGTQKIEEGVYMMYLDSSDMYGNPYNFESYYNQEKVFDIAGLGTIKKLTVDFYQLRNFNGTDGYVEWKDDFDVPLFDNLFVNDVYVCAGYNLGEYSNDFAEIYTANSSNYDPSQYGTDLLKKDIGIRWVHIKDGEPIDMTKLEDDNVDYKYEVRWYRYEIGAAAADEYCGVYWAYATDINGKQAIYNSVNNRFVFEPDTHWQQEKIKAIIVLEAGMRQIVDENTEEVTQEPYYIPYHTNELEFTNQKEVPNHSTTYFKNALQLDTDDGTHGNYLIYNQNNDIKETVDNNKIRKLVCQFDHNGDGVVNPTDIFGDKDYENVEWVLPTKNTMLVFEDVNNDITNAANQDLTTVVRRGGQPQFKLRNKYSSHYNNNTVVCTFTINGKSYVTEREFTFGPSGTMGTEQTLVIDFEDDSNAIDLTDSQNVYKMTVRVYNQENKELTDFSDVGACTWEWFVHPAGYGGTDYLTISNSDNKTVTLTKSSGLKHRDLYIIKVTVGDLITYYPIALKSGNCTHLVGPTQVIYQASGEVSYYNQPYILYNQNTATTFDSCTIVSTGDKSKKDYGRFDAEINNNKLSPISVYVDNAPAYGVYINGKNASWTQPILVLQNLYPSNVINKWDGKKLTINEGTGQILSTMIAAGSKNSDNQFSGVLIGDWSDSDVEDSVGKHTGVYGFHEGAMSYAWKDDGTGFIGKSGDGRIEFDGTNATISSANYKTKNSGMMIDLGGDSTPYIDLKYTKGKVTSEIKLSADEEGSEIYLQKDSSRYIRISSGAAKYPLQIGSNKFYVEWDGTLHATDGEFKGEIDTETGTIGGWSIGKKYLISKNSSDARTIELNSSDGAIYVGENISILGSSSKINVGSGIELDGKNSKISLTAKTTKGPIIVETSSGVLGYFGYILGNDGTSNTNTIGIQTINSSYSIVLESARHARVTAANHLYLDADEITIMGAAGSDPTKQHNIYARFA